jgi:hypothetical protein
VNRQGYSAASLFCVVQNGLRGNLIFDSEKSLDQPVVSVPATLWLDAGIHFIGLEVKHVGDTNSRDLYRQWAALLILFGGHPPYSDMRLDAPGNLQFRRHPTQKKPRGNRQYHIDGHRGGLTSAKFWRNILGPYRKCAGAV